MKNQLKLAFGIALMSVFSIGCKKNEMQPQKEPAKFTVSSITFKDGVNPTQHNGLTSLDLSWKNAPPGTETFVIMVKDHAQDLNQHTYWTSIVAARKSSPIGRSPKELLSTDFRFPTKNNGATACTLEVIAMKSSDLGEVQKEIDILKNPLNTIVSDNILGIARATYKIVR